MTKYALIPVYQKTCLCAVFIAVLLIASCSNSHKGKLQGDWKLKSGDTKLKITANKFAMDSDLEYAEDYFVKGDTIFTSFEGNQPYTKFVVQNLDEHDLKLLSPDSTVMEFIR